jgi:ATP-dependent Clp protease adapter protein ClpS
MECRGERKGPDSVSQSTMITPPIMKRVVSQNHRQILMNRLFLSIFGSQDTNQDDMIGMIEFESGMAKLGQQMKQEDGLSSASGMSAPPPPPDKVFDTADPNEDGIVTKEELEAVMGKSGGNIDKLFGQIHTDGDGSITRAKDEAFRAKMPERTETSKLSGLGTESRFKVDWQTRMLGALPEGLTAAADSSSKSTSTSLYA